MCGDQINSRTEDGCVGARLLFLARRFTGETKGFVVRRDLGRWLDRIAQETVCGVGEWVIVPSVMI